MLHRIYSINPRYSNSSLYASSREDQRNLRKEKCCR